MWEIKSLGNKQAGEQVQKTCRDNRWTDERKLERQHHTRTHKNRHTATDETQVATTRADPTIGRENKESRTTKYIKREYFSNKTGRNNKQNPLSPLYMRTEYTLPF